MLVWNPGGSGGAGKGKSGSRNEEKNGDEGTGKKKGKRGEWGQLKGMVSMNNPDVVMLVETKSEKGKIASVEKIFGNYEWVGSGGEKASKGITIGFRKGSGRKKSKRAATSSEEENREGKESGNDEVRIEEDGVRVKIPGQVCVVDFTIREEKFRVAAVYRHKETNARKIAVALNEEMRGDRINIVGGDFNLETGGKGWKNVTRGWGERIVRLPWDLPTHDQGGCIDHIFFDERMTQCAVPFISATPTTKKDHYILMGSIGGTTMKQRAGRGGIEFLI